MRKKLTGFTLIELMIVIVILGILLSISVANFINTQNRAKISSVKANMHLFQTMLETYSIDNQGVYPINVLDLNTSAKNFSKPYWKDFKNPFNGSTSLGGSYADYSITPSSGVVYYDVPSSTVITTYYIYGGDITNNTFIKDYVSNTNFVLSNN